MSAGYSAYATDVPQGVLQSIGTTPIMDGLGTRAFTLMYSQPAVIELPLLISKKTPKQIPIFHRCNEISVLSVHVPFLFYLYVSHHMNTVLSPDPIPQQRMSYIRSCGNHGLGKRQSSASTKYMYTVAFLARLARAEQASVRIYCNNGFGLCMEDDDVQEEGILLIVFITLHRAY